MILLGHKLSEEDISTIQNKILNTKVRSEDVKFRRIY